MATANNAFEGVFWTEPPEDDTRPIDPLGLDAMRDELSDLLVPCLTGRTHSHEEFYWSLVFFRWAAEGQQSESKRIRAFLEWERCLKLSWAHQGRDGFNGLRQARIQGTHPHAPSRDFRPLLKNQRTQGLLGSHLGPIRKLHLMKETTLSLNDIGMALVAGAGEAPNLEDGDWKGWARAFGRAGAAYDARFRNKLRGILKKEMPDQWRALDSVGWTKRPSWRKASDRLGERLKPYAALAAEYCPWADEVRSLFQKLIYAPHEEPSERLPPRLPAKIPSGLKRWDPLRFALKDWRRHEPIRVLANLHGVVFGERGHELDLWLRWEDGRRQAYPGRASFGIATDGGDCRWTNAVLLMGPGK